MMYMSNPIQSQKQDEFYPDCSVIQVNDKFYRIPNVVLQYIESLDNQITTLYQDMAGESL